MRNSPTTFFFYAIVLLVFHLVPPGTSYAEDLFWATSRQQAFDLATQQGKKVLLIAGRDT